MVSSPADEDPSSGPATDGSVAQLSEDELYAIVRVATEDAVLGALGTLMLVGIGVFLIAAGTSLFFALSPLPSVVGVVLIAYGAYLALSSLRIIPPAREWV
ncbi:hypothetical protein Harman_22250 [Haloarcula mannanilytica]|uniref:Uncharacterized protein n=1 Tax=Haloarcula mannanilytica TaxID=2509225 RepID=A0A4C2ELS2_9EURY|nr:hypothetical protein [Haloarcula mannanilytica]GCF14290.1 hypothetical protein Harman_22250 [Haloarcula mannanilytica]